MSASPTIIGLLTATAVLVGCESKGGCFQVDHPPVTDEDAPLVIGVTFGEMVATVVGERSGPLRWEPSEPYIRGLPPPGQTRITVTVHEPTMAQEIDLERVVDSRLPWRNDRVVCSDWVETDLELALRTDDGALDTTIVAGALFDEFGSTTMTGELDDLAALGVEPVDPNATLYVRLSHDADRPAEGTLVLRSGSSDGNGNGGGMSVELATWTLE
ncbi:hypothetical protein [Paraliomyxa miuraensis]|uniref:hypothetical protein n=1 Tax=Paraliomyxa miuraensis TaxID=376150 RepID=UPI00224C84D5|nr:hypothetical protein [Paraliomyxa miuraensis]MCX4239391.1 hypothetical protein [Paraliomyxa miuraensis]